MWSCMCHNAALFWPHSDMTINNVTYRLNQKVKFTDKCKQANM